MREQTTDVEQRSAYPIKHWAKLYGVSERKLRNDISAGKLRCLRFGRAIRISPAQFEAYVSQLEA